MADDHNPMNPYGGRKDDDERGDANGGDGLEEMLRGLMGGGTPDPQMMDALRQMGMGSMDPAQMGMMQAQLQAMMSGDSGSAFNEQLAANVARQVVSAEGDPSVPTSTKSDVAQVAAVARGVLDDIEIVDTADTLAGRARLKGIDTGSRSADAETELDALLARGTRRGVGDGSPLSASDLVRLHDAATSDRTRLVALDDRADIDRYASIIARSDRARFLTPELHREMFAELTTDPAAAEGIDVASLDLPPAMAGLVNVSRGTVA